MASRWDNQDESSCLDDGSSLRQNPATTMVYNRLETLLLEWLFKNCADSRLPERYWGDSAEFGFPEDVFDGDTKARVAVCEHLAHHPHLLMPLGFDEARMIGADAGASFAGELREFGIQPFANGMDQELLLRDTRSGEWLALDFIRGSDVRTGNLGQGRRSGDLTGPLRLTLRNRSGGQVEVPAHELLRTLRREVRQPTAAHRTLISPRAARLGMTEPVDAAAGPRLTEELVQGLHLGTRSLSSLTPDELEDVVAELARDVGLVVTQTKRTRDGGRDIILEGEFFPGVRARMAVEVTTQSKVGVAKSAKALHQNRHFPLIMLVTCGSFSGGVVQEQQTTEFAQRLFLADQRSVSEWIDRYAINRGWTA